MMDPRELARANKQRAKSESPDRKPKETPEQTLAKAKELWDKVWQEMANYKYHGITLAIDCKGYSKASIEQVCQWMIDQGSWTAKAKPEKEENGQWTTIMRVCAKQ